MRRRGSRRAPVKPGKVADVDAAAGRVGGRGAGAAADDHARGRQEEGEAGQGRDAPAGAGRAAGGRAAAPAAVEEAEEAGQGGDAATGGRAAAAEEAARHRRRDAARAGPSKPRTSDRRTPAAEEKPKKKKRKLKKLASRSAETPAADTADATVVRDNWTSRGKVYLSPGVRAGIGILSQRFTSNGTGSLSNYEASTNAFGAQLGLGVYGTRRQVLPARRRRELHVHRRRGASATSIRSTAAP